MFKKILVTGADGFIGSHVVEALTSRGYSVRAMTLYNSFSKNGWLEDVGERTKNKIEIVSGDVRDFSFMEEAVDGCDAIIHLAALIAIPYSYSAPASYIDTNINGTLNVLKAATRAKTKHIVCTSTSEIYGSAEYVPIDELHPQKAQSPYAASKIGADQLALSFFRSYGTPVSIIRPFNTYGPRQSIRAVIPTIIKQLAGSDHKIELGSLHPTRDFTFVEDTAFGFVQAIECQALVGRVVNIASEFEISISDIVAVIANVMEKDFKIISEDQRVRPSNSEVDRLFGDANEAKKMFNWAPEFAGSEGFEKGIKKTVDWFLDPQNMSHYGNETFAL